MSKPPQRIIQALLRSHFKFNTPITKPHNPSRYSYSTLFSNGSSKSHSIPTPISQNPIFRSPFGVWSRNHSSSANFKLSDLGLKRLGLEKLKFDPLRLRQFSTSFGRNAARVNTNVAKKVAAKPLSVVSSTFSKYKQAMEMQAEGFWKSNYLLVVGAGGVLVCILLWRIMFGIANTFVGLSEGMAKYGFLALSSAIVAFTGMYLRSRYTINPDKVYRIAMRQLNKDAGILEVLGTPLAGTDLRAYVMSGGGLAFTKLKPRLRSKRCFLIFPIRGSERRGLANVMVKKSKGKYNIKLLAVDIPMISGPDQRLYLVGDEEEYQVGDGLIADLRDPVVKAMAATKELEEMDDIEAEEEAEQEVQEAESKHQQEIAKLEQERPRKRWFNW